MNDPALVRVFQRVGNLLGNRQRFVGGYRRTT
jgi:hypothetical protein